MKSTFDSVCMLVHSLIRSFILCKDRSWHNIKVCFCPSNVFVNVCLFVFIPVLVTQKISLRKFIDSSETVICHHYQVFPVVIVLLFGCRLQRDRVFLFHLFCMELMAWRINSCLAPLPRWRNVLWTTLVVVFQGRVAVLECFILVKML